MTVRRTSRWVSFSLPANVAGLEEPLAPGSYFVETDEEQIPGLSFIAYRRIRTTISVPTAFGRQVVEVEPKVLDAALARDALASSRS